MRRGKGGGAMRRGKRGGGNEKGAGQPKGDISLHRKYRRNYDTRTAKAEKMQEEEGRGLSR